MICTTNKYFLLKNYFSGQKIFFSAKNDFFRQKIFFCTKNDFLAKTYVIVQKFFFRPTNVCATMIAKKYFKTKIEGLHKQTNDFFGKLDFFRFKKYTPNFSPLI